MCGFYQYSDGQRTHKTVYKQGNYREERLYFGNYELYRNYQGTTQTGQTQTVHVMDETGRIAMLETENPAFGKDDLTRYIYSNHLQSATLELDEQGQVISYEEYHPYGTTAYQATNAKITAAAKRYRFTGKERDEESGLYYHGARYYAPWLGRWTAVDPLESKYAPWSSYNYGFCNPITYTDPSGMGPEEEPWHIPMVQPPASGATFNYVLGRYESELHEVSSKAKLPQINFLIPGSDPNTPERASSTTLDRIKSYAGDAKGLYDQLKEGKNVLGKVKEGIGYVEDVDDGLHPLETVTMEEMTKRPYIRSDFGLLKKGVKEVVGSIAEHADIMSTMQDIGTNGPASITPATAMIAERGNAYLMENPVGGYGKDVLEDAGFRQAAQQGYSQLAEYVNQTGNSSNIGFAYSSAQVIGREGVTFGTEGNNISKLPLSVVTTTPLSTYQLSEHEKASGITVRFAYWGRVLENTFQIMGQYRLK